MVYRDTRRDLNQAAKLCRSQNSLAHKKSGNTSVWCRQVFLPSTWYLFAAKMSAASRHGILVESPVTTGRIKLLVLNHYHERVEILPRRFPARHP